MMNQDRDARAVARAAIAEWGWAATEMVSERIAAHRRSGDSDGREFWQRVKLTIEELQREADATASD